MGSYIKAQFILHSLKMILFQTVFPFLNHKVHVSDAPIPISWNWNRSRRIWQLIDSISKYMKKK